MTYERHGRHASHAGHVGHERKCNIYLQTGHGHWTACQVCDAIDA